MSTGLRKMHWGGWLVGGVVFAIGLSLLVLGIAMIFASAGQLATFGLGTTTAGWNPILVIIPGGFLMVLAFAFPRMM